MRTSTPNSPVSAVFDGISSPPIKVARTDFSWGFVGGLIGVAILGTIVFFSLSNDRTASAQTIPAPPPPVVTVAPPPPAPPPPITVVQPTSPDPVLAPPDDSNRYAAPAMVVDLSEAGLPQTAPAPSTTTTTTTTVRAGQTTTTTDQAGHSDTGSGFSEDRFAAHVMSDEAETAYASHLRDPALTVPQGAVIPAILETGINSDLPGFVRAVVSRDVRGFDGSTVLIPRGSKLIGQYRSAVAIGVSRAFVVWSRLLTPDGVSIEIGSPATDELGQGGLAGETDSHFFERFGAAILLSVITAGTQILANVGTNDNSSTNTAIVIGSPQQASNVASIALQNYINIPETITVPQGEPLRVFAARDLDFSGVAQRKP
jgi:type IV secretory pathway VirB10-like protein